jgi:hypothetical protein
MAFTSNSDVFISVNEAGINQIVRHVMLQRPSLFNYGTDAVMRDPQLWCAPIEAAPAVHQRGNPLITREAPIPVMGTHPAVGLNFVVQLTKAAVDFSPGNAITLPAELNPPLPAQRLALYFQACAGLGCPPDEALRDTQRQRVQPALPAAPPAELRPRPPIPTFPPRGSEVVVLPTAKLTCFCLDLFAIGEASIAGPAGHQRVFAAVDGLDIVEIKPDGLEDSLLCYLKVMLQLGILAGGLAIPDLTVHLTNLPPISAALTPTSAALPFNPALEEDQLKLFVNVNAPLPAPTVTPCPVPGGGGGGGGGGGTPQRSIGWGTGPAAAPGPDHLIVAVSANTVRTMFAFVRNGFHPCFSVSKSFSQFTAHAAAGGHLENGTVTLNNNNSISVTDLALKWDTLRAGLDVDIPEICVGGFCIIPNLTGGCAVRAPQVCAFSANPDFTIPLDLSGLVTSRLTATIRPLTRYGVETTRPSTMPDLDAEDLGIPNEWAVFLDPLFLHIEFVDIPDFVANLLTQAVDAAVDTALSFLPGWARDLIKSILGGAISIIRTVLGIPGDIVDWLSHLLGVDLNLFDLVTTALAQYLAKDQPLLQNEDPFPILPAQTTPVALIPVKIPVRDLSVQINADEMVLQAKVGA